MSKRNKYIYIVYAKRGSELAALAAFTVKYKCQNFIISLQPCTCEIRVARFKDRNTDMGTFPDWFSEQEFLSK